jgi:hypothetical protein
MACVDGCRLFDEGRASMIRGWSGTFENLEHFLAL